jgi:transposase-like protein
MQHVPGYDEFKALRWAKAKGRPTCPYCDRKKYYEISTRLRYKCAHCLKQYSVTTGTPFASRKLGWSKMALALRLLRNGASAMNIHRQLNIQYVAAWKLKDRFDADPI